MTERPDPDSPTVRAKAELRRLSRPLPDDAFRARLKREFVAGTMTSPAGDLVPLGRTRRSMGGWFGALAAAAAIIAVSVMNRGPQWEVRAVAGAGVVNIDGRSVALDDAPQLTRLLRAGARMAVPESAQIDLALQGYILMQVTGGTEATLPGGFGRWFGRSAEGTLESGELRVTTGPRFHGVHLLMRTPETFAEVAGTTFALIRNADSSCVCVLEGAISMSGRTSPADTVRAGFRRSVYGDGRVPRVEAIRPMEVMKLTMLRDQSLSPAPR